MIKEYLQVTKPGIIFSNGISVVGGFLLASKGRVDYSLLFTTLVGVSLVVASSCVFNNYIDRDIDLKMKRTKHRVFARGLIPLKSGFVYATALIISGSFLLYLAINPLVAWLASMGFIVYVGIYSLYMKRKSIYSTLIGSLAGAIPPVIGYCAVKDQPDTCALILLLIFSLWQMPHSYAIAMFRFEDYQAAAIPALPVKCGILVTKRHIVLYIIGFMAATLMLTLNGYVGYNYLIVIFCASLWWLKIALRGYRSVINDKNWARRLFIFSIFVITLLSIMLSVDYMEEPAFIFHLTSI